MERIIIIVFVISALLFSCDNFDREVKVDKSKLIGIDYRLFQDTPSWELAKAVSDQNVRSINKIVQENPNLINHQDSIYGNTLLMMTIMNQQWKSFNALLENGAKVNVYNSFAGTSAIIKSCQSKQRDIKYLKTLLANGANPNDLEIGKRQEVNKTRFTPLMAASQVGRLDLVKYLIENNANVNQTNEFGHSALSRAVMTERYDVVMYLLENGADYTTPIFYRPNEDKQMYLVDVLREDFFKLNSKNHKSKMKIVDFIESKGIDYHNAPIPEYIMKKTKEKYPGNWKEYLDKY